MPIYEYQCTSCGDVSEVLQRMSDSPLTTCEDCGGELKKLVSAPAFQFKGEGWYVTDYARKDNGKNGKDAKDAKDAKEGNGAKESAKSETTSDSKSAEAKSEAKPEKKDTASKDTGKSAAA